MIKIKALNEDVSTSDSESEEPENSLLTREAQEEHLQSLYFEALKLVDSDAEKARSELESLLELLEDYAESSGLTNIQNLKFLALKNLGLICTDNLDYFLDALAINRTDVTLWIETGRRALNQFTNLPLARACFEEAIQISPTNWIVIDTLIGLYFVLNDFQNCLRLCVKTLTQDPNSFKAHLLISQMLKQCPPISSELPTSLNYLHSWDVSQKDADRKVKILAEITSLKAKRKQKFDSDEENQRNRIKKFTLNLDSSPAKSLTSLTSTLKRLSAEMVRNQCPRSNPITLLFDASAESEPMSVDDNLTEEGFDKDRSSNNGKGEKRASTFPFEFIDKRRSTRVQKIQNKTSDPCELSSDNIYEKIFNMLPRTLLTREIKVTKLEVERPSFNDNQIESSILASFISKQKSFLSKGRRIDDLIDDLLYEIGAQATCLKIPSDFIDLYKTHRSMNLLPCPLTCLLDSDITLEEINLIITANEMDFQLSEVMFLTQMLPYLKKALPQAEYDRFFVRLLTLRGSKESQVDYVLMANEILTSRDIKLIQVSNQVVYNTASLKSMINTLNENNLDKLLAQHRHEELIELLSSKPDLTESEEEYLCQAIISSEQWARGIEIIATTIQLTDRLLKLLRTCLKKGSNVSIDQELAVKLLKLGTEKYNAMAWVCILQTFINEASVDADERKIIDLINTVHQFLGRRGACTYSNGEFLLLALDFSINQCSKAKDDLILQCFACLYNHPPPRPGCTFLQAHSGSSQILLKWAHVDILYSYFIPEHLPEFDSLKRDSIDSDTEILLNRILPLVPEELNPERNTQIISDYLRLNRPLTAQPETPKNHVTQNLYYFLADYYFKNKEFLRAKQLYIMDLALNRDRFDSWAACALSITHLAEQYFSNAGEIFYSSHEKVIRLVESSFRCYIEALRLEPNNSKIWIEYGNLAYNAASYLSRVKKSRSTTDKAEKEKLFKLLRRMLSKAKLCFESANNVADADEIWLHYYFLGKIAERTNILQALKYYELSDIQLYLSGATYPRKIGYHNPTKYAIEALEVHYRIHASVLKYIRRNAPRLTVEILSRIKVYLLRALRSPFVKQIHASLPILAASDHDYISSDSSRFSSQQSTGEANQVPEEIREVVSDLVTLVDEGFMGEDVSLLANSISEMCLEALYRCLHRFPNHYKSLYRIAAHLYANKEFNFASIVLMGKFTFTFSQSLNKKTLEVPATDQTTYINGYAITPNTIASPSVESTTAKSEQLFGLFYENKNNNLFNGIWRIPIDDIDRPGSFSTHMNRSSQLLIKVSSSLGDIHRLSTIAVQLNKTPEVGKKYLRDVDREHLVKDAFRRCFNLFRSFIVEAKHNCSRLDQIKSDLRRVSDRLMRCSVYQKDTIQLVGDCETLIRKVYT